MVKIFSQTKIELEEKILHYISVDESIDIYYKDALKKWKAWYDKNVRLFDLKDLKDSLFYRAYYEEPDIYGIQIWEEKDDMYAWNSNLYINSNVEENDEQTIIIN